MSCQMEVVLSTLISNGYNLNYRNGTFKKYVGNGDVYVKIIVYLEEVHLMSATQINNYLKEKEQKLIKEWLQ